jgi:hypothetical protein
MLASDLQSIVRTSMRSSGVIVAAGGTRAEEYLHDLACRLAALAARAQQRADGASSAADAFDAAQCARCIDGVRVAVLRLYTIAFSEPSDPVVAEYARSTCRVCAQQIERVVLGGEPPMAAHAQFQARSARIGSERILLRNGAVVHEELVRARRVVDALEANLRWLQVHLAEVGLRSEVRAC